MTSRQGIERRKSRRVAIVQEMFFGNRGTRKMDDISEEGMFITTPDAFMKGSILDLKFRLFNDDHPITVKAEVRYVHEGVGMGVRFTKLKAEDRERIKKFTERF
ncbi:MAG: PilZ domain-containing protein [Nitrospirae bacterium]|nr:PilZ domain-containing protein [Nitrospirota bacterium]